MLVGTGWPARRPLRWLTLRKADRVPPLLQGRLQLFVDATAVLNEDVEEPEVIPALHRVTETLERLDEVFDTLRPGVVNPLVCTDVERVGAISKCSPVAGPSYEARTS